MVTSFIVCLIFFILIGAFSFFKSKKTTEDYLVAGQDMKPWLVGLSAVSTTNSGFMFTGMIGYTYVVGLSSVWLLIPWILGDLFASFFIHKPLRAVSNDQKAFTFSAVLSKWHGQDYLYLRRLSAIIIILFLGVYAAAQLSAGGKALHVVLDWDYKVGAMIGSLIVLIYCFSGGIRASIWTDVAQSIVMIVAMCLLSMVAFNTFSNFGDTMSQLEGVSSTYMSWFPEDMLLGPFLGMSIFVFGYAVAGVAVIGQPHIMGRFLTLDKVENMNTVRLYYYGWYFLFSLFTILTGLAARVLLPEIQGLDNELALPLLAKFLLPEILVGFILAAIFAATMSTADSQILSCSAALTHDLIKVDNRSYFITKLSTLFVTVIALLIVLYGNESVFSLVLIAWSVLGSAFTPLLVVYVLGKKPSEKLAITMILSGIGAMLLWKVFGNTALLYEVAPGVLSGFMAYIFFRKII